MQRFSEMLEMSLRDHGVEVVVLDSDEGFDHFRPLFGDQLGAYSRAVFVTDSDVSPREVKSDDEIRADVNFTLDPGLAADGATATATGYGTFEFNLLRTAIAGDGNPAMIQLLHNALAAASPTEVTNSSKQLLFVSDFLDTAHPALAYQKMKETTKGTCVESSSWYADWHTNSYFKRAKSDFAFHLYEALAKLPDRQAKAQFTVPRYIVDAIRFVTHSDSGGEI
jgi:hypothetical protein